MGESMKKLSSVPGQIDKIIKIYIYIYIYIYMTHKLYIKIKYEIIYM